MRYFIDRYKKQRCYSLDRVRISRFHCMSTLSVSTTGTAHRQRRTKPSAERMRRMLDRRRRGFRCLTLEYCTADVDGLVRSGFLDQQHRDDPAAIERAIAAILERL